FYRTGPVARETSETHMGKIRKRQAGGNTDKRKTAGTGQSRQTLAEDKLPDTTAHLEDLVAARTVALAEKEQYYRSVLHDLHEDILIIGPDYRITDVNHAALVTTGHKRQDVIGRHCYEISHGYDSPCDEHGQACPLKKVFTTGRPANFRHKHTRADNGAVDVDILLSPLKDQAGSVTHVIKAVRDVTDLVQAQTALQKSEEKFRLLYERSPLGYQSLDEDGYFVEVNQTWLDLLGYSRDEVIGNWFGNFIAPECIENFRRNFSCFKEAGEVSGIEFQMVRKDGSHVLVAIDGRIGYQEDGSFRQTHCVLHDITERRKAEEKLHQYERIVSSATDMLALVDQRYVYLAANAAYLRAFAKTSNEVIGRTVAEVFGEEFFSTVIRPKAERCLAGENIRYQAWYDFPAAGRQYMDAAYTPYLGPDSEVRGFVVVSHDITERKRAEEALRQSESRFRTLA
ncbi:hypothetical protein LCGC14_2596360, partial [marine sediment metagenome]